MSAAAADPAPLPLRILPGRLRRACASLGRRTRGLARFLLALVGASYGVLREALRPGSWRRTTRAEFRTTLRQAAGGGVLATVLTGTLVGAAAVAQAMYWLGIAGLVETGGVLVINVLLREFAPILVGIILLGRSGMPMVAEIARLGASGRLRTLEAEGIDSFILLVLPRSLAFAVSGFTLGIVFAVAALLAAYVTSVAEGVVNTPLWSFMAHVATSIGARSYVAVPIELALVGYLVGLSSCLTGLGLAGEDGLLHQLAHGFGRGILTVMSVSILFAVFA